MGEDTQSETGRQDPDHLPTVRLFLPRNSLKSAVCYRLSGNAPDQRRTESTGNEAAREKGVAATGTCLCQDQAHPRGAESAEIRESPRRIPPGKTTSDFIIAEAAARYFKAQGLTKLPGRKALQAEIEQLISEKDGLYNTYHEQKQRFRELQTVKRNIDQIFAPGRAAPQKGAEP